MSSSQTSNLYDDLVELLAIDANPSRVLGFRLPESRQQRLDELLDKNREGTLSDPERQELATFEQLEHVVRLLKAKVLQQGNA